MLAPCIENVGTPALSSAGSTECSRAWWASVDDYHAGLDTVCTVIPSGVFFQALDATSDIVKISWPLSEKKREKTARQSKMRREHDRSGKSSDVRLMAAISSASLASLAK